MSEVCNDGYSVLVIFSLFYPRCFLGCVKTFLFMFSFVLSCNSQFITPCNYVEQAEDNE